nr:hypothetical protein L204_01276 [Cryptococcus depauperatus CBS 7855]
MTLVADRSAFCFGWQVAAAIAAAVPTTRSGEEAWSALASSIAGRGHRGAPVSPPSAKFRVETRDGVETGVAIARPSTI